MSEAISGIEDPLELLMRPGSLSVLFQPIVDLRPRRKLLHGVECLAIRQPRGLYVSSRLGKFFFDRQARKPWLDSAKRIDVRVGRHHSSRGRRS